VRRYLTSRNIEFEVRPRMVRGLDYYMRTTFEVVHGSLGTQNSVLGGGRYDGLAESLGSKVHGPGIGFSIGEDRLVMSVEEGFVPTPIDIFIAPLGEAALIPATLLARDLRKAGLAVELAEGKLKRTIEIANKLGARFTLILGEDEIATGLYTLKNMTTGEQLKVAPNEIVAQASRPATNLN
jgi:histidyl-tRNA synthetase